MRSLFSARVHVETADPHRVEGAFLPGEEAMIRRAVEKRRREYLAGRLCARRALGRLGVDRFPLINDADRAPVWPDGVVGSIAHTDGLCVVAVARSREVRSVGVDVERDLPIKAELLPRIFTDAERNRLLAGLDPDDAARRGRLVFSAKEAFYKCQYPLTRTYLGFHDVEVELDLEAGRFETVLRSDAGALGAGTRMTGRIARRDGFLLTAVELHP